MSPLLCVLVLLEDAFVAVVLHDLDAFVVPSPTLAFFLAETQVLERSFESCLPTIPTLSKPSHSSLLPTMMTTILIVTL